MATTKKELSVKTYEVGVKNRKPFTVEADRVTFGSYGSGEVKFHLKGTMIFVAAPAKWDYVRLIEDEPGTP